MEMEFVYVVPRRDLFGNRPIPHGFIPGNLAQDPYNYAIAHNGFFAEREFCERNSWLKQIIPYGVLMSDDNVFVTKRIGGGESRLTGKMSIGIGGHINPVDCDCLRPTHTVAMVALIREIHEEVKVSRRLIFNSGVINDDTDKVGSVHFGLVYTVETTLDVQVRETDNLEGRFWPKEALKTMCETRPHEFESWSRLIIPHL